MDTVHNADKKENSALHTEALVEVIREVNPSAFLNSWGPTNVVHTFHPELNMQGVLIIDNTCLGPSIGRIRISPDLFSELSTFIIPNVAGRSSDQS